MTYRDLDDSDQKLRQMHSRPFVLIPTGHVLFVLYLLAGPLFVTAACCVAEDATVPEAADRPNILFIAVDDLRPSLGCYGDRHAISPNIDRLAGRGVQFNRAYCQVAVCNPSRASLMTGLRPDTLGVWTLPIHFREAKPDAITLPQWFRIFGYHAVSHGKIFHNPTPDPQSWSEPIRQLPRLPSAVPENTLQRIRDAQAKLPADDWRKNNLRGPSTAAPELRDEDLIDGARTNLAIEDLRRLAKDDQPFFLAMGYIRPHLAWIAPKKYWDMHDPTSLPVVLDGRVTPDTPPYALSDSYEMTHYVDLVDFPKPWDERRIDESQARHLMHAYYACVSFIDAQIGRLLNELENLGVAENTIVVLWSDHGWKLGEFNGWGKMTNYEIDTRVPLIIAGPGVSGGARKSEELAELVDLFPTLCDLAGIDTPAFVEGTSLAPHLSDPGVSVNDAAFSQYYRKFDEREYIGYAMRTDSYRLVQWRDFATGEVTAHELYDHRNDHGETENIADSVDPVVMEQLTEQLIQSHPRRRLRMTPAIHSNPNPGRWRADLVFRNELQSDAMVYPISPSGRRGGAKLVSPGDEVTIAARIGGVYVVESRDGTIHEIHSPSLPTKTIVLRANN